MTLWHTMLTSHGAMVPNVTQCGKVTGHVADAESASVNDREAGFR